MELKFLSEDMRREIDRYVEVFPTREQAIIQSLHLIYDKYRDIQQDHIQELSDYLKVPVGLVEGIVSFYDMFRIKRGARHHIRVCKNLPCNLMGCRGLIRMLEDLTGEKVNQKSKNGRFHIETVECIGSCSIAPAFMIDDDLYNGLNITEESLNEILSKYT